MREISVTVTCGEGSEIHNHDLEYRSKLEHVHKMKDGVIELWPYRPYKEQINELMKPYIDDYNAQVDVRYAAAWERYNSGKIKTKPRKRDYKHMDYDYYAAHKDDKIVNPGTGKEEKLPIFRSMILGLGDMTDRKTEKITEKEAVEVFKGVFARLRTEFPWFHPLGFSVHMDEEGFFHAHFDYKPIQAHEFSKGLQCTVSQDTVLEGMGFEPEQSIINGRDKVPLLFNALRNRVYHITEDELNKQGIMLQYGVSEVKDPGKDSSKNQRLSDWQTAQDIARTMQHNKNVLVDTLQKPNIDMDGYGQVVEAAEALENAFETVKNSQRSRLNKDNVILSYNLFSQLKSYFSAILENLRHLFHALDIASDNAEYYRNRCQEYEREVGSLEDLQSTRGKIKAAETEQKAQKYEQLKRNFPDEVRAMERSLANSLEDKLHHLDRS